MWARFKDFDLYRKIPKDLTETSFHSTVLSIAASIFMLVLFIAELWAFLTIHTSSNIVVDPNTDALLRINFNITVLDMPCEYATIDVVDVLGTRNDNVSVNINKWQVDENGIRRGYEGRNLEQPDLLHDKHHDLEALHRNGVHAVPIDAANFEPWLSRHEYTFVDFYAPWCIWCQKLHPVWEAFAEKVEASNIAVSVVQVDCVENRDLCMNQKIMAFPTMRLFRHGVAQAPDYRNDRTVEALTEFILSRLSTDEQVAQLKPEEQVAHKEKKEKEKEDHPGCMLSGFLLVNRVPGNFHIEMRSKHHNINPPVANLSHVVNSLSFGPVLPKTVLKRLSTVPNEFFSIESTESMNNKIYRNDKLHQAFHHYIKVVSTTLDLGGKFSRENSVLAYQMVHSSQLMMYEDTDVPEARFAYDLSPMSVSVKRHSKHWYEFVTSICALIGGTFTVMGLVSSFLSIIFKPKKI